MESIRSSMDPYSTAVAEGGNAIPFPYKLHLMLEAMEMEAMNGDMDGKSIVCWQPHGKAFKVHQPKRFVDEIMPYFFNQTKYPSFQRQLNIYGFSRITKEGPDKGAVYHSCFIRGQKHLVAGMVRRKIKGTKKRRVVASKDQPDFYKTDSNIRGVVTSKDQPDFHKTDSTKAASLVEAHEMATARKRNKRDMTSVPLPSPQHRLFGMSRHPSQLWQLRPNVLDNAHGLSQGFHLQLHCVPSFTKALHPTAYNELRDGNMFPPPDQFHRPKNLTKHPLDTAKALLRWCDMQDNRNNCLPYNFEGEAQNHFMHPTSFYRAPSLTHIP